MTPRRSITCSLGLIAACGLANPIAQRPDGTSSHNRVRAGVGGGGFSGDCEFKGECAVQISLGHAGIGHHRAEVVAVRVVVGDAVSKPLPIRSVSIWRGGAYREWSGEVLPVGASRLSIDVDVVDWNDVLAPLGPNQSLASHDLFVEVDVAFDGEPLTVRSIFGIPRESGQRVFVVT